MILASSYPLIGRKVLFMKLRKLLFVLALALVSFSAASAQKVGIKTNLLYDAALSPNLGVEIGLAPRWSLDISGNVNFWTIDDHKWKHWIAQPEARYWFCERFAGNFLGFHAIGGQYNFGNIDFGGYNFLGTDLKQLENHRLQGWMAGAGIAYGYSWILGKHWNFEAEIGIGWIYTRYDRFICGECGAKDQSNKVHNYVGPTKAALNIVYLF